MTCRTCRFDRLDRNRCRGLEDVSDRASTSTSTPTPQRRVQATVQLLLRTSNSNFQGSWFFVKRWVFFVKCTTRTSNDIAVRKTGLFLLFFICTWRQICNVFMGKRTTGCALNMQCRKKTPATHKKTSLNGFEIRIRATQNVVRRSCCR